MTCPDLTHLIDMAFTWIICPLLGFVLARL